ncbi:unnamed protein product [Cylindrotheca closterium]|uniref:Protein kinase domain-containing protein n=1 Tax=Cylindrotheca closterium TaxID=2856 RepID=A0AAD2GC37_9STRA|nr:unnamed protein product [Cylindrotheca closterium]
MKAFEGGNTSSIAVLCSMRKPQGRRARNQSVLPTLCVSDGSISNPYRHSKTLRIATWVYAVVIITFLIAIVFLHQQVESLEAPAFGFHRALTAKVFGKTGKIERIFAPSNIVFQRIPATGVRAFSLPKGILTDDPHVEDYGDLTINLLADDKEGRQIFRDRKLEGTDYRPPDADRDDDQELYYDFDDDINRGIHADSTKHCRRMSEHRFNFQNCNRFHEQSLLEQNVKFLANGGWRQVFALDHDFDNDVQKIALKDIIYSKDDTSDTETYETVRMDALVAERLSANPRTYDIYGYCGYGILSEYFYHGDVEEVAYEDDGWVDEDLSKTDVFEVHSKLTGKQKLVLALEMAEGIALLHGFSNGVIVHDDVQMSQFLLTKDRTMLKINDFNRAEFMLYDDTEGEYCRYTNGVGHGNWRSPEEYKDEHINEKIDVWSLGNNFYSLLSGMYVFPWMEVKETKKAIKAGNITYIDPRFSERSKEEARLVEVIKQCFIYDADERPSIFKVVELLKDAVSESLGDELSREEVLKNLPV